MKKYDVIVIGGGAAGLMAAIEAGKISNKVLLIEHTDKIGEKIRISGGGRCNFTNLDVSHRNFICQNPHFVKSALAGFNQYDFINLIESYNIKYHEKTLGQLFCDGSSKEIINMLLDLCYQNQVEIRCNAIVNEVSKITNFQLNTNEGILESKILIIATGGLSIPKIGASDFGYRLAERFQLNIIPTRPSLVPLTMNEKELEKFNNLRGISAYTDVYYKSQKFTENILFTHKGLSGPAILQISSFLDDFENEKIKINLLPKINLDHEFISNKNSKQTPANFLKMHLANRLVDNLVSLNQDLGNIMQNNTITELSKTQLNLIAEYIHNFQVIINGSESYQKAEVTGGGIDTNEISSKNMEVKTVPGLFFTGEVLDVTGWLGGYNFQWAWASGYAAGRSV